MHVIACGIPPGILIAADEACRDAQAATATHEQRREIAAGPFSAAQCLFRFQRISVLAHDHRVRVADLPRERRQERQRLAIGLGGDRLDERLQAIAGVPDRSERGLELGADGGWIGHRHAHRGLIQQQVLEWVVAQGLDFELGAHCQRRGHAREPGVRDVVAFGVLGFRQDGGLRIEVEAIAGQSLRAVATGPQPTGVGLQEDGLAVAESGRVPHLVTHAQPPQGQPGGVLADAGSPSFPNASSSQSPGRSRTARRRFSCHQLETSWRSSFP